MGVEVGGRTKAKEEEVINLAWLKLKTGKGHLKLRKKQGNKKQGKTVETPDIFGDREGFTNHCGMNSESVGKRDDV